MKRLLLFGAILLAALFLWDHRDALRRYTNRDIAQTPSAVDKAEKSAERARNRVNQGRAVENGGIEAVKEGMSKDDVIRILGDPSTVETTPRGEVWHYDSLNRRIVFRRGTVDSIEPPP